MELSKNFPRVKMEDTLEAILDSTDREVFVNYFIKNFNNIREYEKGINAVLNHEYFKSIITRVPYYMSEWEEGLLPIIEYIIEKKWINYKVDSKLLKKYYYHKGGMVNEDFVTLYGNNDEGLKSMIEKYGPNAIHLWMAPYDTRTKILDMLGEENIIMMNQEKLIDIVRIATLDYRLKSNKTLTHNEIKEVLNKVYNTSEQFVVETSNGDFVLVDHNDGYFIKDDEFYKANKLIKNEDGKIVVLDSDRVVIIYPPSSVKEANKWELYKGVLASVKTDTSVKLFGKKEVLEDLYIIYDNELKKFEGVKLWDVLELESGNSRQDVILFSRIKEGIFGKPIEELYMYLNEKEHLEKILTLKDDIINKIMVWNGDILIATKKNMGLAYRNDIEIMKTVLKTKNNYVVYKKGRDILIVNWDKEIVIEPTERELQLIKKVNRRNKRTIASKLEEIIMSGKKANKRRN